MPPKKFWQESSRLELRPNAALKCGRKDLYGVTAREKRAGSGRESLALTRSHL